MHQTSGQVILLGVAVCLAGIAVSGLAGMSKEKELTAEQKQATIQEFSFVKGILVATFSGVMSASFAYGLAAGKPIAELAKDESGHGATGGPARWSVVWQNLPVLVVVLWGGFTTNFIWCVMLNIKNRSGHEYLALRKNVVAEVSATEGVVPWDADELAGTAANSLPNKAAPAVRSERSAHPLELLVLGHRRDHLVHAVLLLQHGRDADGQVQVLQLDAAHGQHHHLQHVVGNRAAGMERHQQADARADRHRAGHADPFHGHRRLRQSAQSR